MNNFPKSSRNTIKRSPKRGHYDRETVYQILDAGFICHVGFTIGDQPYVIPNAYGREGDTLYLHGAIGNRLLNQLEKGIPVCVTVTHTDGIVLARSVFHHSFNYRSAVVFGTARLVAEEEKEAALLAITEQIMKGRWDEARTPTPEELKITKVLAVTIEEASAKIRTGPPKDDEADYELPIWAGVLPLQMVAGEPIPDPAMKASLSLPDSVRKSVSG
ncbi:MAG: pyridoxamine 5'-phosphate oxidase family protein [Cyclobacteriaceae bacterium]|jgi:nitroimidazol reductase NimA-like FMN-containing flavoprotein (pyridoxamine 5'-phosphate oxidase superfamily)